MAANAYPVAYRTSQARSTPSGGFQGPRGFPANFNNPASRRDAVSKDLAKMAREIKVPPSALGGFARGALRKLPWIGAALTLWEFLELVRMHPGSYQGYDWTGWTIEYSCGTGVLHAIPQSSCGVTYTYLTSFWNSRLGIRNIGGLWYACMSDTFSVPAPGYTANVRRFQARRSAALPYINPILPLTKPAWISPQIPRINPSADPMQIPIGQPMPVYPPLPWEVLPHKISNPWRVERWEGGYNVPGVRPWPRPGTTPRPGASPQPMPEPLPPGQPGYNFPPQIQQPPAAPRPPRKREKERKFKTNRAGVDLLRRALNITTETFDWIDAIFEALPEDCQRPVWDTSIDPKGSGNAYYKGGSRAASATRTYTTPDGVKHRIEGYAFQPRGVGIPTGQNSGKNFWRQQNPYEKARSIYRCAGEIDFAKAVKNIIANHAIDTLVGKTAKGATRNFPGNRNRPVGPLAGPAI